MGFSELGVPHDYGNHWKPLYIVRPPVPPWLWCSYSQLVSWWRFDLQGRKHRWFSLESSRCWSSLWPDYYPVVNGGSHKFGANLAYSEIPHICSSWTMGSRPWSYEQSFRLASKRNGNAMEKLQKSGKISRLRLTIFGKHTKQNDGESACWMGKIKNV